MLISVIVINANLGNYFILFEEKVNLICIRIYDEIAICSISLNFIQIYISPDSDESFRLECNRQS